MARGWESKSVEEQQSEFGKNSGEKKAALSPEEGQRILRRQSLELNRARVMEQIRRSTNPRYTGMLQGELEQLDRELASLE